jgi:hypothetical protein
MVRPRWHDALIVTALVGLLAVGVWALWWDDVRSFFNLGPENPEENAPISPNQT